MVTHDWLTANINLVRRFSNHSTSVNSLEGISSGHFVHMKIIEGHERSDEDNKILSPLPLRQFFM